MEIINNYSPTSKVWVYQASRDFTPEETQLVTNQLNQFISNWNSHGAPVDGGFEIKHNRFIVLIASEQSGVSGCSIDSSVKVIRDIEANFNLGLLDRSIVSYLSGKEVKAVPFTSIKKEIEAGNITPNTTIFNNTVSSLSEFENSWLQKAENSWISRYF